MKKWREVKSDPPPYCHTVLCQHEEDLYPSVACRMNFKHHLRVTEDIWMADKEGPEDGDHQDYRVLFRAPTHWQELPESPLDEAERLENDKPKDLPECLWKRPSALWDPAIMKCMCKDCIGR